MCRSANGTSVYPATTPAVRSHYPLESGCPLRRDGHYVFRVHAEGVVELEPNKGPSYACERARSPKWRAVAIPITCPYLQLWTPAAMSSAANLCPAGTSSHSHTRTSLTRTSVPAHRARSAGAYGVVRTQVQASGYDVSAHAIAFYLVVGSWHHKRD